MNKIIELKNLCFTYEREIILEDINLSIPENTFLGIIGPNGAGKTTLIKIILGLLTPTTGTISVFGKSPLLCGEQIGYVPQHSFSDLSFPITVFEVVLMGRMSKKKLLHRYTKEDRQIALNALDIVGMKEFQNRQIKTLSGGQRQRVLLARALAGTPQLLILDEPLSGIDISLEFQFYELLKSLKEKMTIILISHDIGVMSQHVDNVVCLNKHLFCHDDKETALKNLDKIYGCPVDIIAHGTPHRVLKEHQNDRNA